MKRISLFVVCVVFIITGGILLPGTAYQQDTDIQHQETVYIDSSIIKENTFFGAGQNVEFAGRALRDVVVAGRDVLISGPVEGNVIVAGEHVRITGDVEGSVFVAGGSVQIDSRVHRNVYILAGDVVIAETAQIGWSVITAASTVDIRGHVRENVRAGTGSLTINGQVEGGVTATIKGAHATILLLPRAIIGGDIQYLSSVPLERRAGAIVRGEVRTQKPTQSSHTSIFSGWMIAQIFFLVNFLFLSFIISRIVPNLCLECREDARAHIPHAFGIGLLGMLVVPAAGALLLMSGFGVYTAMVALFLFFVLLTLSLPIAGAIIGQGISHGVFRRKFPLWTETLIGAGCIWGVGLIPFLGFFLLILCWIFGFGILLLQILRVAHILRVRHTVF